VRFSGQRCVSAGDKRAPSQARTDRPPPARAWTASLPQLPNAPGPARSQLTKASDLTKPLGANDHEQHGPILSDGIPCWLRDGDAGAGGKGGLAHRMPRFTIAAASRRAPRASPPNPKRSIKRSDSRAAPGGRASNTAGRNAAANAQREPRALARQNRAARQAQVGDPLGAHSWRSRSSPRCKRPDAWQSLVSSRGRSGRQASCRTECFARMATPQHGRQVSPLVIRSGHDVGADTAVADCSLRTTSVRGRPRAAWPLSARRSRMGSETRRARNRRPGVSGRRVWRDRFDRGRWLLARDRHGERSSEYWVRRPRDDPLVRQGVLRAWRASALP
jgi:hypothetical protein